jgi:hypothetical protein
MQERGNEWLNAQEDLGDPTQHMIGSYLKTMDEVTDAHCCVSIFCGFTLNPQHSHIV